MEKISIVIPYVDNTDEVWKRIYKNYCVQNNLIFKLVDMKTDRYEDIGFGT